MLDILSDNVYYMIIQKDRRESKMKKAAVLMIGLFMLLSLTACSGQAQSEEPLPAADTQQTETAVTPGDTAGIIPEDTSAEDTSAEDQDFYMVATSYSKKEVEDFAAEVRGSILAKDWKALSEKMYFPVYVSGEEVKTAGDFLDLMNSTEISDTFFKAVESETCKDMSANSHGIMFGDGEVWIAEYREDINAEKGELYVIALNL